jgi:ABC-type glycerol-3-phosphate transport system permease component
MIENRPVARVIAHLMLVLGIIIVAFPIYYTFIASSMTSNDIIRPPMSLLPGDHLGENYKDAMVGGVERVVGVSLERLVPVGLRHRVFPLSIPHGLLLDDLHHAHASGGSAHPAHLQGHR